METLQPKLRFPEFDGNWKLDKLGDLFNISAGGDIKKEFVSQNKSDIFKYPIYANAEKNKGFYGYASIYKFDEEVITVAGRGVNIGIAHSRKEKFYPIVRLLVLKPKKETSVDFFEYAINNFDIVVESTGVPQLTAPQISNYEIFYTDFKEQTKIANFLSSVDEKLNLLNEKKETLEAYKKGIMQKIFNQEIRFKDDDGNDFEDWEEKSFKSIFKSIATKKHQIQSSEINFEGAISVIDQGKNRIAGFSEDLSKLFSDYPIIVFGDHTTILKYIDFKFIVGADGTKLLKNINNDNLKYLYYNLIYNNVEQEGYKRHFSILSEIELQIPSLKEQTKIANFLSAIDEKIELVNIQIEDTEEYKKGLLQQMFV